MGLAWTEPCICMVYNTTGVEITYVKGRQKLMSDKTAGWITRAVGILVVIAVFWSIKLVQPDFYSIMWELTVLGDIDGMTAYMASFGYKAIFVSVLMVAFVNAIGIPSVLFLTVNGVIFGLVPGIVISWVGEVVGIEINFRLTRTLFRGQAKKVISRSNMLERLDSYSCIRTIMAGRAIPYVPNVFVTALGALSHISYRDHFVANAVGKLPAVAIEVWLGHDLLLIHEHWPRLLAVSAIVAFVYGLLWWRRRHQTT